MNNKYKILLVEDELNICNFIRTVLEANSYHIIDTQKAVTGLSLLKSHCPNLVILDLGLPDMDGTDFIREVRTFSNVPILVLSARSNENDKILELDLGANDYVTKPFGIGELLARVRAILRTSRIQELDADSVPQNFTINDLTIVYDTRKITVADQEIKLTQTEYNIVELLSLHAGKVMTYSEIIHKIWGYSDFGSIKKLQVNMANIRKKLGEKPGENKYILNELGVGYRMNSAND